METVIKRLGLAMFVLLSVATVTYAGPVDDVTDTDSLSVLYHCYTSGVPESVWEFKVGGYQVCEKWLKDRRGRALSMDDITHYQRIVVALKETIRLMAEIDKIGLDLTGL